MRENVCSSCGSRNLTESDASVRIDFSHEFHVTALTKVEFCSDCGHGQFCFSPRELQLITEGAARV
jgi:ribosomal protein L32